MPGIAGIIGSGSPDECQRLVRTMIGSMQHQRSYASGIQFFPGIGVYGGWVAHEESFAARHSAFNGRADVVLLFSGECLASGGTPATAVPGKDSDMDSLRRLYDSEASAFVAHLNGLFSGLLIDTKRKRALLFNDRYGSERIYYYEQDGNTYFASEAKALLSILPELRRFDDEGVAQFLKYGSTLGGRTLFHNVRLLPGASLWTFAGRAPTVKGQYFRPEEWETQSPLEEEAFDIEFERTFRRVLPGYLCADSQIGISLTGGLDTRMIMACIANSATKAVCYTFGGLTGETLDASLGAKVARTCGLEHHILRIGPDFLSNYGQYVDRTVSITDGCAGALGAHEIYLTALARQLSPVRLTGNFGSEILRSMSTFKPIGLASELIDASFRQTLSTSIDGVSDGNVHPVTHAAFEEIPWHLFGTLAAGRSQLTFRTPYLDNEIVKLAFRAPPAARESPRSALRLIHDNSPALGAIPTDRGLVWGHRGPASLLRRVFCGVTFKLDYLHKEGLPSRLSPLDPLLGSLSKFGLLGLHKFLPYRGWFRRELAPYVGDVLAAAQTRRLPYWNSRLLPSVVADHVSGRKNYLREIHAILTLEAVDRVLIRGFREIQPSHLIV